jgi:ribosomal protein S18 acetylase RimI-like enzyme
MDTPEGFHREISVEFVGNHLFLTKEPLEDRTSGVNTIRVERKFAIKTVRTKEDLDVNRTLFQDYAKSLNINLNFQDFETELANLPGKYAPPTGELLFASTNGIPLGCAALRPLFSNQNIPQRRRCCEMKRLWVTPEGRGTGVGKALVEEILKIARALGYEEIKLDTLPTMDAAIRLYEKMGFVKCDKYYDTPIEGTVFLAKSL